ncbi:MAG: beta-ketoacyl-[acyl-carrier-protein] synthase II, partial [Deltaproteobacteria bacterium]|nr:beta-ketoacyl-[acyl-carrier-protein] synthase II [Deltaproteobacteria bacterium]
YIDAVIAGASEAPITAAMINGWCKLRALSARNDNPAQAVRPFSKDRDGPVLGEGAGAVILESLDHALARGARIYAEIAGYWSNSDAFHLSFPHVRGQIEVMEGALRDAGLDPEDIGYINAHGTATPANDKGETEAIKTVFGKRACSIPVSSTKSMIGHLLGAAGAVEIIATILAMKNSFVPPTINYAVPDPECDLDYVPNEGRPGEINAALSNSFGFGGANAAVIVKKYE